MVILNEYRSIFLEFQKHRELAQANRELADVAGEIAEGDRTKRRNEAIENLIRVFPDKVGILKNDKNNFKDNFYNCVNFTNQYGLLQLF